MLNIAVYLRKSRENVNETREETLARHEKMLRDYCINRDLNIIKVYREVGSGSSLATRPAALELLDQIEAGAFDGVAMVDLERLSRGNTLDQYRILEAFKSTGTKIFTLDKVYDFENESDIDEDAFEIGLFLSRREYQNIRKRLIRGKKHAQREGYFIGSKTPFGFSKELDSTTKKGYILTEYRPEADIVRLIFEKFVFEDLSLSQIRDFLDSHSLKPRYLESWNRQVIKNMLSNEVYIGRINIDAYSLKTRKTYPGKHAPIIPLELFESAREKLLLAPVPVPAMKPVKNPLAGVVVCGKCGKTLQKQNEYIKCITKGCKTKRIELKALENKILTELRLELDEFSHYVESYESLGRESEEALTRTLELTRDMIKKKEDSLTKLDELLELEVYSIEKYRERSQAIRDDITAFKLELDTIEEELQKTDYNRLRGSIPILAEVLEKYSSLSPGSRNKLLKGIIQRVEYFREDNLNFDIKIYLHI